MCIGIVPDLDPYQNGNSDSDPASKWCRSTTLRRAKQYSVWYELGLYFRLPESHQISGGFVPRPPDRVRPQCYCIVPSLDKWTIKTPNPTCRLFFKIDLLTDFADFKDSSYIYSWLVFSTQLVNCCPHELYCRLCRRLSLRFWPDSEPKKLLYHPKQNDQ